MSTWIINGHRAVVEENPTVSIANLQNKRRSQPLYPIEETVAYEYIKPPPVERTILRSGGRKQTIREIPLRAPNPLYVIRVPNDTNQEQDKQEKDTIASYFSHPRYSSSDVVEFDDSKQQQQLAPVLKKKVSGIRWLVT